MDSLLHYLLLLISILVIYKLFFFFFFQRRCQYSHHKNLPPTPPSLPLLGHFLHFIKKPLHIALHNLSKKHGPILFLQLGTRQALLLSDLSAIQQCFTENDIVFSNRPLFPSRRLLEYNFTLIGITPYGHHWRSLRKFIALQIFSRKRIQMSSRIWVKEIKFVIKQLYSSLDDGVPKKVHVMSFFYVLTFNIMMRMVAGKRFIDEEMESDTAKRKLEELRKIFNPAMSIAWGDYFPFIKWLPFYGVEKRLLNLYLERDKFMQALIDARRNAKPLCLLEADDEERKRAIIDVMVSLQESEPETYTDDVIKAIILAMLIGGTETTTVTMDFAVSQLISNPEILRKAREEIDINVGKSKLIEDADLSKLPYLHCIINEALRLGPTVSILPARESSEECTVGGYNIPRGTMLLVNAWAVHRDPELWEDPNRFKPERFEESSSEGKKEGLKFVAFGAGRRQCPGAALAIRLMALTLGSLIQCFEWQEDCNHKQALNSHISNNPRDKVTFRSRQAYPLF